MSDEEWNSRQADASTKMLPYVFVAYTQKQFNTNSDYDALLQSGGKAARRAGVSAFWAGCSCFLDDERELEEDVYRINDVIQGAYSLAIAVREKEDVENPRKITELPFEWGSRMWTFSEALLSPTISLVKLITEAKITIIPYNPQKKELPSWVWRDADKGREMMDHFYGLLTFESFGICRFGDEVFVARQTEGYLKGDVAYVLMGLMRRRPMVDITDSQFQALA